MRRPVRIGLLAAAVLAGALAGPVPAGADPDGLLAQLGFGSGDAPRLAAARETRSPEEWLAEGHAARARNELERAIALYRRAGDGADALFWLATVQRWVGDLDGAAATYARLLERFPDHVDGLLGDARVALRTGATGRAVTDLTRAADLDPDRAEARQLLVRAHAARGDWGRAYALADRAFAGDERLRARADIAFRARWYGRAARDYRALLNGHPDDPDLALALGRTYERQGYLDRAATVYADALRSHPDHADLQVRAAAVQRWLGEADAARRHADAALAAAPDRPDALIERAYQELARDHLDGPTRTVLVPVEAPPTAPTAPAEPAEPEVPEPTAEAPAQPSPPAGAPVAPPPPLVIVHRVVPGDTLGGLAQAFLGDATRWGEVWEANPFVTDPDRIYPGQKLLILVQGAGVRQVPHRVRRGESLSRIARAYLGDAGMWPLVWLANPAVIDPDRIEPGQTIRVPIPRPELPPGMGLVPHVVRPGETLGSIARDHLGDAARWTMVWRVNPELKDPNRIRVGHVLNVPRAVAAPSVPVAAAPAPPAAAPRATPPAPEVPTPAPAPRLVALRDDWGAAQWARRAVTVAPASREGRALVARVALRRLRLADAREGFDALHAEAPPACDLCAERIAAREATAPVLDASFGYDVTRDLDGRADPTVAVPTPVRYRTVEWGLGARHRVAARLTLGARYGVVDTSLTNRNTGARIYDYAARTGELAATVHLGDRHTLTAAGGATDYRPDSAGSIADRRFTRLRLAWDRTRWNGAWHVSAAQGPYLGRSIPPQAAYTLFRERRLDAAAERRLTPRATAFARYAHAAYQGGPTLNEGALGARLRLGTHHLTAEYAQEHQPGRFLDEAGGGLAPVFVRARRAEVSDRWRWPFPFRFAASARVRTLEANTLTVGGTPYASPSNRETAASLEAAYAHPALSPLAFGAGYDYVDFDKNAFAYDTVDSRGPDLFAELADADGDCWSYRLRYTWGVRWDEDPANAHYVRHLLEGTARVNAGARLSAGLSGRYFRAAAYDGEQVRLTADLTWRF